MVQTSEEIKEIGLVYVTDSMPGLYRKGKPGKFYYEDHNGQRVKEEAQLERIKALVLPPAWTEVWIAAKKNAYLQATGLDAAKENNTVTIPNGLPGDLILNITGYWNLGKLYRKPEKELRKT